MNPLILDNFDTFDSPIIVALDYTNEKDVMQFVSQLSPSWCKLKVGKALFTSCGPKIVEKLVVSGFKVFLDLKFHDIPNTVYMACQVSANLGVWMVNVHASGGGKMLEMARQGIDKVGNNTLLIAVTILTSIHNNDLPEIGIKDNIHTHIINLSKLSYNHGIDGVVCSAFEANSIKAATSLNFLAITPGIRLQNMQTDDQIRIMTPEVALKNHADYLVIGRPITESPNPQQQLLDILAKIKHVTVQKE